MSTLDTASGQIGLLARTRTAPDVNVERRAAPRPAMSEPAASKSGRVVHLVGRLSEPVFGFLRPATEAIAQTGVEQCVVLRDDPRSLPWVAQFDAGVHLVTTPDGPGLIRRWRATRDVYRQVFAERSPTAVHLHGVRAWLGGAGLARRANPQVRLYYTPSTGWTRGPGLALWWLAQRLAGGAGARSIVELGADPGSPPPGGAVEVIESPVGRVFLETPPNTARRPLIVTSSGVDQPRSALTFAQLAVLLGDESLGMSFNWFGATEAESRAALKAANVGVFDVKNERERAQRLSCGWVYLAAGDAPGFPLFLVEAMALGLPCIAPDTPFMRSVIRHRESGILCRNSTEIRQAIAELIDAPALRQRLGAAARADVQQRFGEGRFRESVLSAYELPTR
jgi:glycosyltransferase involved in cell wall biosynthesis